MNTLLQNAKLNDTVQPFGRAPKREAKLPNPKKRLIPRTLAVWMVGLVCGLFGMSLGRAVSPADCTGSALGIDLFTDLGNVHVGDTLNYSATVFNGLPGSPRIACDASGIVAGIVTPDGKTNMITLVRTTLLNGQSDFYTNVVSYVVRAQDIQAGNTLRATAFDSGDIHQNNTTSRGGAYQGVNTRVNSPCLQISVQCTPGVGENGVIQFSGSVTNCGNDTLVGVTVTNFVNGGQFTVVFPTNLLEGQVATFSGSWIPAIPCIPSTATLVALGSDQFSATPRQVTSSADTTCMNVMTPVIAVGQTCPTNAASPGGGLTYNGFVKNTGNVTLTNVVVVSSRTGSTPVFTVATLAPGVVANFIGSFTVPPDTGCSITSGLTATGNGQCSGTQVTASVSTTCPLVTAPAIQVTQACPPTAPSEGGTLTFSGTVRNTGNITLTNVTVFNDRTGTTPVFTAASLAPGASANFTGSYTVPLNCCTSSSTVRASGKDACTGISVADTATSTCPVLTSPKIVVTKVCPTTTLQPGDLLKYSGSVSNAGNIALINVTVVNSLSPTPLLGPITLAPGESVPYTASYIIPPDFCGADTVTATGVDDCTKLSVANSVTTTCPVLTTPRIAVTQTCPPDPTPRGGIHTFTGTVSNPGNVTLTNVFVVNNQPAPNTAVIGPITLAPGATRDFSGSYTAQVACCEILNTITARGQGRCTGTTVTATSSVVCPLLSTPLIAVTRVCPTAPVSVGSVFVFNGTVSNTGDVYLTNVFVRSSQPVALLTWQKGTTGGGVSLLSVSSQSAEKLLQATKNDWFACQGPNIGQSAVSLAGNNSPVLGPIELAPGESKKFRGSYVVTSGSDPFADSVTASAMDTCLARTVSATADCADQGTTPIVKPDIIFQNQLGFLGAWFMNGTNLVSSSFLNPDNAGDTNWVVVGNGDFNGDGNADLLFQHEDGTLSVWFMQGIKQTPPASLLNPSKPADLGFKVVATGDFNKDGKSDILLQNTNGVLAVWYMNGTNAQSNAVITPNPGADWKAVGTGDFNHDGALDIVFQHTNGDLAVWFMNGLTLTTPVFMNPPSTGDGAWRVAGTIDLNHDGNVDLLFQNRDNGKVAVWYLNGINLTQTLFLYPSNPGDSWKIVAPR